MAPALFAPAPPAPRPATASGTSVLPGVPLPTWALPDDVAAPAAEQPGSPALEPELAAPEPEPSVPVPDAPVLPELGDAAWDAPAPEPLSGSHRFTPADQQTGQQSDQRAPGRARLLILLGLVAVLALAAFAAFVTPGFLTTAGDQQVPAPVPAAPAAAAPVPAADYFTQWALAMHVGVTGVTKVGGLPAGTSARCGTTTIGGAAGTACAFTSPGTQGTAWYPKTGLKPASQRVAALVTAAAR